MPKKERDPALLKLIAQSVKIPRVYEKHGAWYYHDLNHKVHYLCRVTDGDSAKLHAYAVLLETKPDRMMSALITEWETEHLKDFSQETQKEYRRSAEIFRTAFQKFQVHQVKTSDIHAFIHANWKDAPNMAKKMVDRLAKIFKLAIVKGMRDTNPCDAFDRSMYKTHTDTNVIYLHELNAIRAAALNWPTVRGKRDSGPMFVALLDMTMLTWARSQEARTLTEFQIDEKRGYLRMKPGKTERSSGLSVDIKLTDEMREIIHRARALKKERGITCSWLFPAPGGTAYTRSGLGQMWNKYKAAAGLTTTATFRHVRPFGATEAHEQGVPIEEISTRLVHSGIVVTKKYLRTRVSKKSELDFKVRPAKPPLKGVG